MASRRPSSRPSRCAIRSRSTPICSPKLRRRCACLGRASRRADSGTTRRSRPGSRDGSPTTVQAVASMAKSYRDSEGNARPSASRPAVRGPGPAPVLAGIRLGRPGPAAGCCDAVPASGAVGRVHEGPVGRGRSPAPSGRRTLVGIESEPTGTRSGRSPIARRATDDTAPCENP